ncbi:MAG: TolC family protein [Fimbriimonadales bacterium]|nr:MAG: hypothetical protein KatS3mg018_0620 [Fimbriimonadales bacterium]
MKRVWWYLTVIGISGQVYAHSETESQVIATVITHHPQARALRQVVESESRLRRSAHALQSPTVFLAPELSAGGVGEQFLLHQPLEMNGARRARIERAHADYTLALAQAQAELNDLLANALEAYYEYLYRAQIAAVAEDALRLAEQTREKVRLQVEAGVRAGIDLIQAEIEQERVRQYALLRQAEAAIAREQLQAALGGVSPETLNAVDARTPPMATPSPDDAPVVRIERARLQQERAHIQTLRATGVPDVGVQIRIERFRGERTRPAFGLSLSLPFVDYGARQESLRAAQLRIEAQQGYLRATQLQANSNIRAAEQRAQQARARAEAYRTQILPKAQQLAQSAQIGLESGQFTLLQLLEAQRTARQVQEETLQAEMEWKLAEVQLRQQQGAFAVYLEVNR